ncbi:tetratricopeptide repeat protein [Bradyrhizobium sp. Tv2a-2]|uniref:tetratricopeptide repeat protein n=1 Tax=Bradyrhizobium sp. Tv2a-2 TaxID=113395 RepID=UPI0007C4E452|nr:tetratricopeptide repeat protein [Bradyrhizobium sp. Tv2a-2]
MLPKVQRTITPLRSSIAVPLLALALVGCSSPQEKAQNYYQRGMELIAKGDDLAARVELLKAIKYTADKVDVWRALAGIDERTKAQSLFLDLRRIVELDPNDLAARLKLVRIMLAGGATDAAAKVLELAREGDTPNAELHALKAAASARSNDPGTALREATRALSIDPNNVDAVSFIAARKLVDGDTDGALRMLDGLRIDSKDEMRVAQLKVQVLVRMGDLKRAEEIQHGIVDAHPKDTASRLQLVQLLGAERKFDEAEKELRARVDMDPSDKRAVLDLVRFLNTSKGLQAARAELENRIKSGGDVFDYQLALAEVDISEGKVSEATDLLQGLASSANAADRKAAANLKLAEIYVSRNNLAAAEPIIAEIIAGDRRNTGALRLRAAIKIDRGQIDDAIADLREALNDQPKSSELLLALAAAYERGGKRELADRQYADAMKSSGFSPPVVQRYVAFLQRNGDRERAESVLIEAAGRNPGNAQVLSSLAQVRLSRSNWAGARAVADAIAKNADGRVLADEIRAASFTGENKGQETIAALEDAHNYAPDAFRPIVDLVSAYLRDKQPEKANLLLQGQMSKSPANAQLLALAGRVNLAENKDDLALGNFKAAVAAQPQDPVGYLSLADFYARKKDYVAAIDAVQAGMRDQPDNLNLRLALGNLQIQKGDFDAAIAQYDAILKDQPGQIVAINNYVSLVLDHRTDNASIERAMALAEPLRNSHVPQFQDTYGWVLYKRGEYQMAVKLLAEAAPKMADQSAVHYHLGMSYRKAGDESSATEQFKLALHLEPNGTALHSEIAEALGEPATK